MQADTFLILRLQDRLFADPRRIALLKQIAQTGSISQGAKLAGISYKSAWDAINAMNQLSEKTLVERATGGKAGGGAVITVANTDLQLQVKILLADARTRLYAAVTASSASRLLLAPGKEVQVLIKAPWVSLTHDPTLAAGAENQLTGIVTHIDTTDSVSEVRMTLPGGQRTVCPD